MNKFYARDRQRISEIFAINRNGEWKIDFSGGHMRKRKRHHKRALPPRTKTGRFRKRRRSR